MKATKRHKEHRKLSLSLLCLLCFFVATSSEAQVLGDPVDISQDIDWGNVELRVFSTDNAAVQGLFTKPDTNLQTVSLTPRGRDFVLRQDPQAGKVKWTIKVQNLAR